MLLSLQELELRKVRFDVVFQAGELDYLDPKIRQVEPLATEGVAELLGATREIRVQGRLRTRIECDCDRCLEAASFEIDEAFDLFYRPPLEPAEIAEEQALDEGSVELGFYSGEGLRLEDILQEQVLLALPMQRLCGPECQGICPLCGANRNRERCHCTARLADERWAALRSWKQSR